MPTRDDAEFLDTATADRLAALPTVQAVALGGSPAQGTHRPDSDWDLAEAEAEKGRFRVEPSLFHLAGIPSYLVVAELAINRVLRGELPCPDAYPEKLRRSAVERRHGTARAGQPRAEGKPHRGRRRARRGRRTGRARCAGGAGRGEWVTSEKRLLERAGLWRIDDIVAGGLRPEP